MSPGSTSSGCTCLSASAFRAYSGPAFSAVGELRPDVARQVGVGRLPRFRFGVAVDQVAQLGDDRCFGLAVQARDVRQVDAALVVERDQQPSSAVVTRVTGGFGPTTSFFMIADFSALPVASSYSSSDITSMASGSSRNFTRLGMRLVWPSSFVWP